MKRTYHRLIVKEDCMDSFVDIYKSINNIISAKCAFGKSRHQAKKDSKIKYNNQNGSLAGYSNSRIKDIFSYCTANNYRQVAKEFSVWLANNGCTGISDVTKEIAEEYLRYRISIGLTPETVSRDMSAINKMFDFGISKESAGVPNRCMKNHTRSRLRVPNDNRDTSKYTDQITIAKATGLRRASMLKLCSSNFVKNNGIICAVELTEKGGKRRIAPILNWINVNKVDRKKGIIQS